MCNPGPICMDISVARTNRERQKGPMPPVRVLAIQVNITLLKFESRWAASTVDMLRRVV